MRVGPRRTRARPHGPRQLGEAATDLLERMLWRRVGPFGRTRRGCARRQQVRRLRQSAPLHRPAAGRAQVIGGDHPGHVHRVLAAPYWGA